jgi:hypothetical protein
MAKNSSVAVTLVPADSRRGSPLAERLNSRVLETIRDIAKGVETDPGIEDEYEFEIFGDTGPTPHKKKKK